MKSLFSIIGTGVRISALATFAITAAIGAASASTCNDVENSWPSSYNAACVEEPLTANTQQCSAASQVITTATGCCNNSPYIDNSTCINNICNDKNNSSALSKVDILCP